MTTLQRRYTGHAVGLAGAVDVGRLLDALYDNHVRPGELPLLLLLHTAGSA